MQYPAYVEIGNETEAWSVILPDFPDCFPVADHEADLPAKVQEAVKRYFERGGFPPLGPSSITNWKDRPEFQCGGVWMLFDLNVDKLSGATKAKRFNATLLENLLDEIDCFAAITGSNRSRFLAEAAREKLSREK